MLLSVTFSGDMDLEDLDTLTKCAVDESFDQLSLGIQLGCERTVIKIDDQTLLPSLFVIYTALI